MQVMPHICAKVHLWVHLHKIGRQRKSFLLRFLGGSHIPYMRTAQEAKQEAFTLPSYFVQVHPQMNFGANMWHNLHKIGWPSKIILDRVLSQSQLGDEYTNMPW